MSKYIYEFKKTPLFQRQIIDESYYVTAQLVDHHNIDRKGTEQEIQREVFKGTKARELIIYLNKNCKMSSATRY